MTDSLSPSSLHMPFSTDISINLEVNPFTLTIQNTKKSAPIFQWISLRAHQQKWINFRLTKLTPSDNGYSLIFSSPQSTTNVLVELTNQTQLLTVDIKSDSDDLDALSIDFSAAPDEHYLGFGERFNRIDQRGQEIDLYVINGASGGLTYKPIPFYMSSAGYGLRLLTPYRSKIRLACYDDPNVVSIRTQSTQLSFQLWTGKPFTELLTRYTQLLGERLYQPPAWIFGPWKSRDWTAETQSTVEEDLRMPRQLNLPQSVKLIDAAWEAQLNDFQFNQNFPDPQGMVTEARKLGYRIILWVAPWIVKSEANQAIYQYCADRGFLIKNPQGQPYVHRLGNSPGFMGTCLDFTNPEAVAWWQSHIERLVQMGFDGFKTDFGEQVPGDAIFFNGKTGLEMHNLYPKIYNQVTYEAMQRHTHGILLARSAWDGSQPYCALFGGDQSSDFGPATGLPSVIKAAQNAGISGFPFYASDIGGYFGQPTESVFSRWIAFGAFLPIMQLHGLNCREPWKFSAEVLDLYRHYAQVHTDLFPYIYSHALLASKTGVPIVRAMAFTFPEEDNIWHPDHELQYAFGNDLIVSPVYSGHSDEWYVYLPQGEWRDFWNGETREGGRQHALTLEKNEIAVFAKAGAIIPLLDPSPHTLLPVMDEPEIKVAGNDLRLQIYPGADGEFQLHDGTQFSWKQNKKILEIQSNPLKRWVSVKIMGESLQLIHVQDGTGKAQPIQFTNLNGDPGHIRFIIHPGLIYRVSFS